MRCTECSQPLKPIFVSDIDGTLGDYHTHFTEFCTDYYDLLPRNFIRPYDGGMEFEQYLGLNKVQYREAKLAYRQGGSKRWMSLYPYAKELIDSAHEQGCDVWICTTRPWQRLDNIDPDTREWMRRNFIQADGMLYGDDKYRQLCETVDDRRIVGIVEDLPEQFDIARGLGLPVYQVYRSHNAAQGQRRTPGGTLQAAQDWLADQLKEWYKKNKEQ